MDKYEYKIRAEEIRELIKQKEYAEAVRIADTIDWRRVKSITMLCTVSDLYKINRRFEESRDLLLLAYDRHPGSRTIVYSLCELSIKMGDIVQAVEYYKEYVQLAPKDTGKYILQYKLYEAQEVSLEERIEVLEEFKKRDYREKWGYELAYLYHRIGLETKCVEECDQLILWFGKGRYVIKAMELKMLHEPLTPEQELKYRELKSGMRPKQVPVSEPVPEDELPIEIKSQDVSNAPTTELPSRELDIQVKPMKVGQYDTINLQKALAESMKELLGEEEKDQESQELQTAEEAYAIQNYDAEQSGAGEVLQETEPVGGDTIVYTPVGAAVAESETFITDNADEGQSETEGDMPEEIADGGVSEEEFVPGAYTQEIIAPLLQDTDEMRPVTPEMLKQADAMPVEEPVAETEERSEPEPAEEIFFEDVTSEMPELTQPEVEERPEVESEPQPQTESVPEPEEKMVSEEEPETELPKITVPKVEPSVPAVDLNPEIAKMLSQEYDGQISLVVPEQAQVEKQITGQLSIEDVLAEWERMKKENEQKRAEETKKRVLEQTGALFSEFDESTRNGILEQLQAGEELFDSEEPGVEELEEIQEADDEEAAEQTPDPAEEEERLQRMLDAVSGPVEVTEPAEGPETLTKEAEVLSDGEEPEADGEEADTETAFEEENEEVQDIVLGETAELPDNIELAMEAAMEAASDVQEEERTESSDGEKTTDVSEKSGTETDQNTEEAKSSQEDSGAEHTAVGRPLSDEEKDLYGSFIQTKREKHQIVNAVDNMSLAPYTGNIIITGDAGVEKVELAKNLIKELQMSDANFSGKVAKITGKALNKKDVEATLSRIPNGALIIEKAGDLKPDTLKAMNKALEKDQNGIMIVMEDTKKAITNMLEGCSAIADNFTSRIDIEALNNDALVAYAKRYARELEYSIDELGVLALYTKIADMQTSEHVVTAAEVREMIDDAIYSADRKNLRHLMDILTGRRYDDEDMVVLKEHDFML